MLKKSKASVLIFTLLFLSAIAILTQQLMQNLNVHTYFASTVINREKAKLLCLSGIKLAMAQLKEHKSKKFLEALEKKHGKDEKKIEIEKDKKFLSNILPHLNRWQVFNLHQDIDGIDGELKICISIEAGKLNINKLYDFKNNDFILEIKPHLESLILTGDIKLHRGEFIAKIIEFFKKRKRPLDDVSELLKIEGFTKLQLFYEPPMQVQKKEQAPLRSIALADLFTVWTEDEKINPLFLSDSATALLELRRPEFNDSEKMKSVFDKIIDSFLRSYTSVWNEHWDLLLPLYGKVPPNPGFASKSKILSQQFDPTVYTVICCGKVNGVEQRILVIIAANKSQNENKKNETMQSLFKVVKTYWL